jgi:hypothetical protein
MFSKKPSFDESPLQDLSEEQMNQAAGGCDSSSSDSWNWKHHRHHHHHHMKKTTPVKVEIIIETGGKKYAYWENGSSSSTW